jgi:hypothetical protein
MPPSVHASGHVYLWGAYGEEFTLEFPLLLSRLRVAPEPAGAQQPPGENSWKTRFRGDLSTLSIVRMCTHLGIAGQQLNSEFVVAGCTVRCPWINEHTRGREWSPNDSSTAVFHGPNKIPGFKCLHVHCAERSIRDFLEWCESQEPGIVDRHCARIFSARQIHAETLPESEYVRADWPESTTRPPEFTQKIFYPQNSILHPFMEYGRKQTEGDDAYLLGSILSVCSSLVARRVHIDYRQPSLPESL